ncbi:MAG: hypothetical protein WDO15_11330 [Bacteroidota bacterium]
MSYLSQIKRLSQGDNLAGIVELKVLRKADITSMPSPANNIIDGSAITYTIPVTDFVTWEVTTRKSEDPNRKGAQ